MNKFFFLVVVIFSIISCSIKKPKEFTLLYNGKYTGLDTITKVDGLFYEPINNKAILFYRDGLSITTQFSLELNKDSILKLFEKEGRSSKRMQGESTTIYGRYILDDKTIVNQLILYDIYNGSNAVETKYRIFSKNKLYNLTDSTYYTFYPIENRMDSITWLLKKKWFWTKEAWDNKHK